MFQKLCTIGFILALPITVEARAKSVVRAVVKAQGAAQAAPAKPVVRKVAKASAAAESTVATTLPQGCVTFYDSYCDRTWSSVPSVTELRQAFQSCCVDGGHSSATCDNIAGETFDAAAMSDSTCNELVELGKAHENWAGTHNSGRSALAESAEGTMDHALTKKGSRRRRRRRDRRRRDRRRRDRRRRDRRRRDRRRRDRRRRTPSPTNAPTNAPTQPLSHTATYTCDDTVNWVNGVTFSQISLTDGCSKSGCDNNPKYGAPMTLARAVAYCETQCDNRAGCTGFFFQKHNNGHEICGFYSSVVASNSGVRHGHMYGAVCIKPTAAPTNSPTNNPTSSPTNQPTSSPTNNPTSSPTNNPTNSPTNNPTNNPTNAPTNAPTVAHLSLQEVMTCPSGVPASQTLCMSSAQYDQIVGQIHAIMTEYKTGSPCTNNNCKLADFAGCVLRAAGHDFMDFRSGMGGSDGCLRFDDPDNKGLINCLKGDFDMNGDTDPDAFNKTLHDVYKNFCDTVSLADFIVMAGEAVMGFTETSTAVNLKQDFHDRFMYGRSTRGTCADAVALPNPANGCAANEVTFLGSDAFGMTWRQTAALMGVHTIGKASLQNSGYSGWWQDEQNVARFNNNYYISIVNHGWEPAVQTSGKSQWGRSDTFHDDAGRQHPEMMLNTDMCLVYNNVFAESSNCCAWERFDDLHRMNITETHDGTPIYCGFKGTTATLSSSFGIERGWCCVGQSTDCAPRNGDSLVPQGPAQDAVHAFAADQDLWLGEFKSVWKLATEKGAGALKALEQSCGAAPTTPAPPPNTGACRVTVYEHWPEGITAGIAGLEAAEQAWGGHFPTGAKQVLQGTGNFPLQALSNLTSSVKVEGACCKAYGYASADCSGKEAPQAVESTTQLLPGLPAGVVTPATGISSVWGCNDCAQCVKVTQQCP